MSALDIALFVAGLALLVVGAEVLVRGASHLAATIGISPLVVGLTVVAFGTSAPEMAVSIRAATAGSTEVALGNVVGSNVFNTLAILGVAALAVPLVVHQKLVRREVPLTLAVSIAVLLLALDGTLGRWEGGLLLAALLAYTGWAVVVERRERPDVGREYAEALATSVPSRRHWLFDVFLVIGGLGLLVLGARWLVDGAVAAAEVLGVSDLVIGLTIVAAGTSLPEAATSMVAGLRGQRDIAVGNVVGSNLFNLLAVLGISSLVAPGGIPAPDAALRFDLPVLVGTAALCVLLFLDNWRIGRLRGALLVALYAAYLAHIVLDATDSPALTAFRAVGAAAAVVVLVLFLTSSIRRSRVRNNEVPS